MRDINRKSRIECVQFGQTEVRRRHFGYSMVRKKEPKKVIKPRQKSGRKKGSAGLKQVESTPSLEDIMVFQQVIADSMRTPNFRVEKWCAVHAPNPAMLRHILAAEGYTVFQWTEFPGRIYGMRKHEPELCHWVISGSVEIVVKDGGSYVLEAGDRSFMPAETYHTFRVLGEETLLYLVGELRK